MMQLLVARTEVGMATGLADGRSSGRMRGPRSFPSATALAQAGSRPPASRTVVKPSSSAPSMTSATVRTWAIQVSLP